MTRVVVLGSGPGLGRMAAAGFLAQMAACTVASDNAASFNRPVNSQRARKGPEVERLQVRATPEQQAWNDAVEKRRAEKAERRSLREIEKG